MNLHSNTTVIIPCYNDGAFILQALQSLYTQTLLPSKIIIVDDGSNNETKNILQQIKHPLVEIIYQENQGVCVARNVAISKANTAFIVNLDADDFVEPTFLEKTTEILLNNNQVGIVSSYRVNFFENSNKKEIIKPLGGTIENFLLKNNGNSNAMFRKKCWEEVGGFDEQMKAGYEDWEFWIAILKQNWTMEIIPEVLSNYRIKKMSRDKTALKNHDISLRNYIFNKHKDAYLKHFEYFALETIRINALNRNTIAKYKYALEYKIGKMVLYPIKSFKKIFNLK